MKELLFEVIDFEGSRFISSQKFHRDVKPTESVKATNRAIRNAPTYEKLRADAHIREVDAGNTGAELTPVFKSNAYRPLMLIDPVAQKALEHHFKVTSSQAVDSSKENAMLGLLGIDLAVIAENREAIKAVKEIHDAQRDGKSLPLGRLRKTPLTKRLDDALSAAKKLKDLSRVISIPHSPSKILKIVGDECDVDLSALVAVEMKPKPIQISEQSQEIQMISTIPVLPPCESEWMIPKELGAHLGSYTGSTLSPQQVNKILVKAGLQVGKGKNGAGPYQITEKGHDLSTQTPVQIKSYKGIKNNPQIHWDREKTTEAIAGYL